MSVQEPTPLKQNAFTALASRLEQVKLMPDVKISLKKGEYLTKQGRSYKQPPALTCIPPTVKDKDLAFALTLKKMKRSI